MFPNTLPGWHECGQTDRSRQAGQGDVPEGPRHKDLWEASGDRTINELTRKILCEVHTVNTLPPYQIYKTHSRWSPSMRVGRRSPTSRSWQRWREPWVGNFTFIFTWNPTILGSTTQLTFTHLTFIIPRHQIARQGQGQAPGSQGLRWLQPEF